jgi:hypothetical protein
VFNRTVAHLAAQGRPSFNPTGQRQYRGPGGLKCAVGIWIPDEKYRRGLEGKSVHDGVGSAIVQAVLPEPLREPKMLRLLDQLQRLHDNTMNWDGTNAWSVPNLTGALRELGRRKKLRVAVIKECFS